MACWHAGVLGFFNDARNIGPTIGKRLNEIGILTLVDLVELTPVKAYQKLVKRYPDKTLLACCYLYSLQGALVNVHWDKDAAERKGRPQETGTAKPSPLW